jgi:predicted Zn-dependent peptidase
MMLLTADVREEDLRPFLESLSDEVGRLCGAVATQEELEEARSRVLAQRAFVLATSNGRLTHLVDRFLLARTYEAEERQLELLLRIDADQVRKAAAETWSPEQIVLALVMDPRRSSEIPSVYGDVEWFLLK